MSPTGSLSALGQEDFVLLTTFRKNAQPVPTPVWIGRLEDELVVSTPEGTGKLKRLRRDSRVTLQACSRRGRPTEGAPVVEAQATVHRDQETIRRAQEVLSAKYGWQWRAALLMERVIRRGRSAPRPVLVIRAP